jgi:nuclear pore complex protein Nup107
VEKFAEVLDGYNPQRVGTKDEKHDLVIELLDNYHNIAAGTVERLRERHDAERRKKAGLKLRKKLRGFEFGQDEMELYDEDQDSPLPAATTSVEDLERWEQEAQTWDLLSRLVKLRYPSPGESAQSKQTRKLHKYSSGREVWETFLETDTLALERKTVLDWLKGTAKDAGEDIDSLVEDLQRNADRGEIVANGWLYTNQAIKHQKRIHSWHSSLDPTTPDVRKSLLNESKTAPLVTQLDPDAPTRQNRKLEQQDQYFERAIWLGCYEMLRRGKNQSEIREWCANRSEVWRAVSMPALPDEIEEDAEITNPVSWALWRRMCFALARNGGGDDYERAVYGILSGDNISVEQVSRSWDDFVFAHYNALLRTQYDEFLKSATLQDPAVANIDAFNAVQFHGEPRGAGRRLIENLRHDSRTTTEALEPMKMLQGVLIADNFKEFIHQQGLALSKFANAEQPSFVIPVEKAQPNNLYKYIREEDHDGLRVLAHVLLIFMHLDVDLGGIYTQTTIENVIVSYIGFLRFAGKEELIPLYCSQLSGPRKYTVLSRMLIDVTDSDQRLTQIRLMRELGLNVQEFVKKQARYVFSDHPDNEAGYPASNFTLFEGARKADGSVEMKSDFVGEDTTRVSRTDILLIRSFEWYLLVDGLWSETFEVGTMLYKRFFSKSNHLESLL